MAPISSLHKISGVQDARSAPQHSNMFEHISTLSHSKLTSFAQSRIDTGLRKFVLINNLLFDHLVARLDCVDHDVDQYEADYDEVMIDHRSEEQSWLDACLGELEDEDMEDAPLDGEDEDDDVYNDQMLYMDTCVVDVMTHSDNDDSVPAELTNTVNDSPYSWDRDEFLLHIPRPTAPRVVFLPPLDYSHGTAPMDDPPKRSVSTPPMVVSKQLVFHSPKSAADDSMWLASLKRWYSDKGREIEWEGSRWLVCA
ncbi:hypothetical protein BC936DRAFT_146975 [Jimgerdemannia flammicorona]|uniref:Uncharacterized protein n=2 Tax=Jimgerdemannia flammicorona TaxID=994334 RepID=A0A433DLD1_9FUNG|nr:hypothetical protein BC936DRAFT_146975 [Jimgerdemannia flammicorona]RUS33187.1 hypothetical protein BC938DRAFT_472718 [Jimgerdemannia flammicorona]